MKALRNINKLLQDQANSKFQCYGLFTVVFLFLGYNFNLKQNYKLLTVWKIGRTIIEKAFGKERHCTLSIKKMLKRKLLTHRFPNSVTKLTQKDKKPYSTTCAHSAVHQAIKREHKWKRKYLAT